jgi:hypothetical protein
LLHLELNEALALSVGRVLAQLAIFFLSGLLAGKKNGRVQLRLPGANKKNR